MADELNIPTHRWYQKRNHVALAKEDFSRQFIYDSGIQKIDAWINSQPWGDVYIVNRLSPKLVFDFDDTYYRTGGTATDLVSATTHARAGNATMVDSDGVLKWAPHNLLTYSGDFSNAAWITNAASKTANSITFTESVNARVFQTFSARGANETVTVKIWFSEEDVGKEIAIGFWSDTLNGVTSGKSSDLTIPPGGEVSYTVTSSGVFIIGIINSSANLAQTVTLRGGFGVASYRSDLGGMVNNPARGDSYVPTTDSAVYLPRVGHHIYNGSAWVDEGYFHESEARTNILRDSNDLTQWTETAAGRQQLGISVTSPDGTANAQTIEIGSTATLSGRGYYDDYSVTLVPHTYSVYLKDAGGGTGWVSLGNFDTTAGSIKHTYFNLASGVLGTVNADHTARIEDVGGGFYRCSVTFTPEGTGVPRSYVQLAEADLDTGIDIATYPQGTAWINHYGSQTEVGSTPSSYIPTAGATATRAAETLTVPIANVPYPTVGEPIGPEMVDTANSAASWIAFGTNTITQDGDAVKVTYVDNQGGGYLVLNELGGTSANLSIGSVYQFTADVKVNTGSVNVRQGGSFSPGNFDFGTVTSTSYTQVSGYGVVIGASPNIQFSFMSAGEIVWIKNISVREINPLAVSIQMEGTMTYADEGITPQTEFVYWYSNSTNNIRWNMSTITTRTGQLNFSQVDSGVSDQVQSDQTTYSPGINVPFNISSRHGSTFINGAVDGVALTADTTPVSLPDLSSTDMDIGSDFMGTIKLFRVWADDLTDAGIAEATLPSLEPSLSLTFDGSETSFTVLDWSA